MTNKGMRYRDFLRALRGHDFDTIVNSFSEDDAFDNIYNRADAIADGQLIDVSHNSRELGFRLNVAVTASAWAQAVAVPHNREEETERLFALLGRVQSELDYGTATDHRFMLNAAVEDGEDKQIEIRVTVGPDERGNSVITVMLGYEEQV